MTKDQDCLQYSTESEFSMEELENFENEIILYNERATIYYKTVADLEDQTPIDFKSFEKDLKFEMSKSQSEKSENEYSNPTTPTTNETKPLIIDRSDATTTVFKKPYFSIFEIFNTLKNICDILISTIVRISPENNNNKKCN